MSTPLSFMLSNTCAVSAVAGACAPQHGPRYRKRAQRRAPPHISRISPKTGVGCVSDQSSSFLARIGPVTALQLSRGAWAALLSQSRCSGSRNSLSCAETARRHADSCRSQKRGRHRLIASSGRRPLPVTALHICCALRDVPMPALWGPSRARMQARRCGLRCQVITVSNGPFEQEAV